MTNAEPLVYNYTPVGDVLTIFLSAVLLILMYVSYIKKEENYLVFRRIPILLMVASAADIFFHWAIGSFGIGLSIVPYIAYLVYYLSLILGLYFYMAYIKSTMQPEDILWIRTTYVVRAVLIISIVLQAAAPVINPMLSPYVFALIYTMDTIILVYMIYRSRRHVYRRILVGVCASAGLAFALVYAELFFREASYTTATYLFPAIALLYLMHSNPYDFALGSVDAEAFADMMAAAFMKRQPLYIMSLNLPRFEMGGTVMPREIQMKVRYYGESFFKNAQLFRISGGHLVLVIDPAKEKDYEDKTRKMLDSFNNEYKNYGIEYKIIFTGTIDEISAKNEYIPFLQYLQRSMDENEVLFVSEEDIADYNKHGYILEQLKDIGERHDLEDPRVMVFCQPVFNTQTGRYDTAEALMRLKLERTGMVFPDQFIPLAERYGYIHTLSLIILAKTCAQIKRMIEEGYQVKRISVNFSMMDVREGDFANNVRRIVSQSGIPFEKVAIEITESQNEKDFMLVKDRINELRDSGIKFYLDDFGTGYSNMERIMELPFDIIKFDRSLTVASGVDAKLETMVSYLAHMFTDMNYAVLYEGIEDEADESRCIGMYARYLQGYKYSKPIPIENLTEYFVKS